MRFRPHSADSTILHLWADRFILGVAPIDYGLAILFIPFGFRLAPDTLSSKFFFLYLASEALPPLSDTSSWSQAVRDFNPPDRCAAQRTLRPLLTSRTGNNSVIR